LLLGSGWAVSTAARSGPGAPAPQASGVSLEPSESLFTVLCALYAAGFEQDAAATGLHPVRARMRAEMLRQQGPAIDALRSFYREHRLADSAATLSRFVSAGLVVGLPPKFEYEMPREQLPPDAIALEGLSEVLADFYKAAGIGRHWERERPLYERELERLREPLGNVVVETTGYLREILRRQSGRTFTVIVEPLLGSRTNFRNFGDRYVLAVAPGPGVPLDEIRHAFLHYLLDPLPLRYRVSVERLQPLHNLAARSPLLPVEYRNDFSSLLTECLVRAAELRLKAPGTPAVSAALDDADQEGFVLVRPLYAALGGFQESEPAMHLFFPDLLTGISLPAETKRLETVRFVARASTPGVEAPVAAAHPQEESEVSRWLREGERQLAAQDAEAAATLFQNVLAREPGHPRAVYGLALASILQGEVDQAKELFHQVIGAAKPGAERATIAGDARLLAWSHIYLGRIYDQEGARELAVSEYRAALAVEGAPESARLAAQQGIEKGYGPTPREPRPGQPPSAALATGARQERI